MDAEDGVAAARRGGRPGRRADDGRSSRTAGRCGWAPGTTSGWGWPARLRRGAGRSSTAGAGPSAAARLVFYDQRSHGKSDRAPEGHSTMEYLASDLRQRDRHRGARRAGRADRALDGRHGDPHPGRRRTRSCSPSGSSASGWSAPAPPTCKPSELNQLLVTGGNPVVRAVTNVAARYPAIFERGRASSRDAVWLLTRSLGFARKDVSGRDGRLPRRDDLRDPGRGDRRVRAGAVRATTRPPRCRRWPASRP